MPAPRALKVHAAFEEELSGYETCVRVALLETREHAPIAGKAQADMYLSTLRAYVEAVGGELELTIRLPKRPALRLRGLGDVVAVERSG